MRLTIVSIEVAIRLGHISRIKITKIQRFAFNTNYIIEENHLN